MRIKKLIVAAGALIVTSMAMAAPESRAVDLGKLYGQYEKAGYSSLELMESSKRILISGVALDVSESLTGNAILKVGARPESQELARLVAADDAQESTLKALQPGVKFKAVCDLAFTSGTRYMSLQACVFK